jgi:hypothetical protein
VLVWVAWQSRACAASQRLPREVFTKMHRQVHTTHKHRSNLSKPQHGEAPHRGSSEAADPEGRDHSDLLGEEAADETTWWSW